MSSRGLHDRRALVTGGSRGIGRAVACALASQGVTVAVNYAHSDDAAQATVAAIRTAGGDAEAFKADISDGAAVASMFDQLKKLWGGVDVLVNNAARTHDGYLMMMSEGSWDEVLDTNLRGAFLCARYAVRSMIAGRWGRIINVISPAGVLGKDGAANYAASKGGLLSMSKSLAREVGRYGITVNAVCPGLIDTELTAQLPTEQRERYLEQIALGRFGHCDEVAAAIIFLASDEARYITGSTLSVDGGLAMV
ncbi:MAG TPA: 3-oxoacyl-ACP reductase family protein [Candidatus Acidoferrales bacterium]|nr:3-oxoacyl-ACP reductase family protein [Candidatus Acidoferrales bacterium]